MRKALICVVVLLALGALAGCNTVVSDKPMGDKPVVLEPADWEGKWLCMGNWVTIRVLDAEKGLLELNAPNSEPEGPIKVSIRESGDWRFANIAGSQLSDNGEEKETEEEPVEGDKAEERYVWGRITNAQNQIVFWLPDADKLADLVEAGKLPGEVKRNEYDLTVALKGLAAEHMDLIMSEKEGLLFEWDEPMAFVREEPAEDAQEPVAEEETEK